MTYTPDTLVDFDGANQTIADHALDYGIPASRIVMRLNAGWTLEKAITRPVAIHTPKIDGRSSRRRAREAQLITIDGITDTLLGWCRRRDLSLSTVDGRVTNLGMSFEEALSAK